MVTETDPVAQPRIPLSRERVLRAAIKVADEGGIESLTMRHLAEELGVEAMSLYYHVANKEALLDGVVDSIVDEIAEVIGGLDMPSNGADWKTALRRRILTAREVMLRHPWAPGVLETRATMSFTMLRYFDGLLGILIEGGFSYDLGHQAMHAVGSRALGFTREMFQPDDEDQAEEDATVMLEQMADQLPYMVGMMKEIAHDNRDSDSTLGWCDYQTEFEFALDLTLDGLERLREEA
jgi:AcrR family transcriptional regulator